MFKVGLELPAQVAKEEVKKQKKKGNAPPPENLQNLMDELKNVPAEKPPVDKEARRIAKKARLQALKAAKRSARESEPGNEDNERELSSGVEKHPGKAPHQKPVQNSGADQVSPRNTKSQEGRQKDTAPATKRPSEPATGPPKKKLTPLQLKMQQKLSGSRFRWINEQLYTTPSQEAFRIFQDQPQVFKEYHDGFRHQVESWPENPVNSLVHQFGERLAKPINAPGGLPGTKTPGQPSELVVADMGCGEAELSLQLSNMNTRKIQFVVHSFDMHKANDRITVADIASVPLPNESVHIVVYCLALMGTNLADFINEGIRILKPNGLVWIAEIKSRFENNDYTTFVDTLKNMGLYHKTTDDSNKMFVKFEFVKLPHKLAKAKNTRPELHLNPCIYKRR